MATHRYMTADGLRFRVRMSAWSEPVANSKCQGSWAEAIESEPGDRVACPVCGRICVVSAVRRRVHLHNKRRF